MLESRSQELVNAEQLNNEGEVDEALKIIIHLEKEGDLTTEDNLECQILKGILYFRLEQYEEAFSIAEQVFQESQRIENTLLSIDSLILQCFTFFKSDPLFPIEKPETEIFFKRLIYTNSNFN